MRLCAPAWPWPGGRAATAFRPSRCRLTIEDAKLGHPRVGRNGRRGCPRAGRARLLPVVIVIVLVIVIGRFPLPAVSGQPSAVSSRLAGTATGSPCPVPRSRFAVPCSLFPVPFVLVIVLVLVVGRFPSGLPVRCSLFPVPGSLSPVPFVLVVVLVLVVGRFPSPRPPAPGAFRDRDRTRDRDRPFPGHAPAGLVPVER